MQTLYAPEPEGVTVSRRPCVGNETIKQRKSYDEETTLFSVYFLFLNYVLYNLYI